MIKLVNVNKTYTGSTYEIQALHDISLEISEGEFVAIMGESGSGKSTLLNMIGGLDRATSGDIYIDAKPITNLGMSQLDEFRKQYISFVFQHFALIPEFSVYENMEIPLLAKNMKRRERQKKIRETLSRLHMDTYMKFFPEQLSGGQQQRVAIARALVAETPILLADEPTGALDRETTELLMELFREIHKDGKTIIVVTHSDIVAGYADRCICLNDGLIAEQEG